MDFEPLGDFYVSYHIIARAPREGICNLFITILMASSER